LGRVAGKVKRDTNRRFTTYIKSGKRSGTRKVANEVFKEKIEELKKGRRGRELLK